MTQIKNLNVILKKRIESNVRIDGKSAAFVRNTLILFQVTKIGKFDLDSLNFTYNI